MNKRDELIINNMDLVKNIIKRFRGLAERDDLEQEGYLALIMAVDNYIKTPDKYKNEKNYYIACITGGIKDYINTINNTIRIPKVFYKNKTVVKSFNDLNIYGDELISDLKDPTEPHTAKIEIDDSLYHLLRGTLTEPERQVVVLYYGVGGGVKYKIEEIAKIMDKSKSLISKIKIRAIEKLKLNIDIEDF